MTDEKFAQLGNDIKMSDEELYEKYVTVLEQIKEEDPTMALDHAIGCAIVFLSYAYHQTRDLSEAQLMETGMFLLNKIKGVTIQ